MEGEGELQVAEYLLEFSFADMHLEFSFADMHGQKSKHYVPRSDFDGISVKRLQKITSNEEKFVEHLPVENEQGYSSQKRV